MLGHTFHDATLAKIEIKKAHATLTVEDFYVSNYDFATETHSDETRLKATVEIENFALVSGDPRTDLNEVDILRFHLQPDRTILFFGMHGSSTVSGEPVEWAASFDRICTSVTDDPFDD